MDKIKSPKNKKLKLPKLPPGYNVSYEDTNDPEYNGWIIYVRGDHHDGIDPKNSESEAIDAAWENFKRYDSDCEWNNLIKEIKDLNK